MSGHSHFKTIKAQKEVADAKRGKIFAKVAKLITIAAKEGPDPVTNPKLRVAIEQAKLANMPKDNVERAIQRGTGKLAGDNLEEVSFEGYGPGGMAIIIEGITDNKNRTLNEVKQILTQNNAKLAGEGAVKWMFERKGVITIDNSEANINKEQLEMDAIEGGADDISWNENVLDIYTSPDSLEAVKKNLEAKGIKIDGSGLGWVPKDQITIDDKEKREWQRIVDAADENDSIQEIYSNTKD